MIGLDSTIVAVANPTIGHHFHATLPQLQSSSDAPSWRTGAERLK
jgi:hypothetical protein